MAPDKLSRDPSQGGDTPSEGVRIIAAEELEEVAERTEVARRRAPDEPGFKDRPPAPPADTRPAIRFPLPDSADPSALERPRPAPVDPPRAEGSVPDRPRTEATHVSLGEEPSPAEPTPAPDEEDWPDLDLRDDAPPSPAAAELEETVAAAEPVFTELPAEDDPAVVLTVDLDPELAAEPDPEPTAVQPAVGADPPVEAATPADDLSSLPAPPDVTPAAASEAPAATPDEEPVPILDLGPSTGEHSLPHWTEPATGEVPKVVIGETENDPEDEERWASFAANGPRWRDEHDTSEHGDLMADLAAADDDEPVAERLGALDTSERIADEAYLNFDDVELDPQKRGRRGSRRGRSRRPAPPPAADPLAAIIGDPVSTGTETPEPVGAPAPPQHEVEMDLGPATRRRSNPPPPPPEDDPAAPRRRRRPVEEPPVADGGGAGRNVPQAVAVGIALAVVALLVFKAGPAPAMVLVELVVVLAGFEFYGAVLRGGFRPATLLGLTAVAALPLAAYWKGEAAFPLVIFLAFAFGVLWYLLGVGGKVRPTANLGVTMVGVVWVGVFGAFAALILDIPVQGVSILIVAIVAAVANDAGGFFIGRAMGRTPLSSISPNKTVEGLLGGILSALVAVFVVAVLLGVGDFTSGQALVFGLCTAVVAPFGDLAESLFKRDLGLKDMGAILPQHGGILDRFDGILFVLPVAYYVTRALGLAG